MTIKRVVLIGAMLAAVSAFPVQAADGFYLGAGIGESTVREDTSSGSFDSSATGYKAFAGYRFNKIPIVDLAAEAGYVDFGKPSQTVGAQNAQFKLHGGYLAGLLIFPIGPFYLYGKGGALAWKAESTIGSLGSSRSGHVQRRGVQGRLFKGIRPPPEASGRLARLPRTKVQFPFRGPFPTLEPSALLWLGAGLQGPAFDGVGKSSPSPSPAPGLFLPREIA